MTDEHCHRRPHVLATRIFMVGLTSAWLHGLAASVLAGPTPDQRCQQGRYAAAAKYAQCHHKAMGKYATTGDLTAMHDAVRKCRMRYGAAWTKLQAKAVGTGAACDAARFVDHGDGSVTDNLTGLRWEKKSNVNFVANFGDPHDGDNQYAWTATSTAADGPAFTSFLASLNGGGCFAGHCDWRLPTRAELQTILVDPCTSGPCIDPIFGPTNIPVYWTGTTLASLPSSAWIVNFNDFIGWGPKTGAEYVRAVRGGL